GMLSNAHTRLSPPAEQLLRAEPVPPRHLRHRGSGPQALDDYADLVVVRPPPPPASPGDQLNSTHRRDAVIVVLAFKRKLKCMAKLIAHGRASSHRPDPTKMWGKSTAYPLVSGVLP